MLTFLQRVALDAPALHPIGREPLESVGAAIPVANREQRVRRDHLEVFDGALDFDDPRRVVRRIRMVSGHRAAGRDNASESHSTQHTCHVDTPLAINSGNAERNRARAGYPFVTPQPRGGGAFRRSACHLRSFRATVAKEGGSPRRAGAYSVILFSAP